MAKKGNGNSDKQNGNSTTPVPKPEQNVTLAETNLPVVREELELYPIFTEDIKEIATVIAENLGGEQLSAFDLPRIRIPLGGALSWTTTTLDGEQTTPTLQGVIIDHQNRRAYWAEAYSGGNEPPQCSSLDGLQGIGDPGGECLTCPLAQFGSDHQGGPGQACKQIKHVLLLTQENYLPAVVNLPPTSLQAFKQFLLRLSSLRRSFRSIIVGIGLEKAQNKAGIIYSGATFKVAEYLTPEETKTVRRYAKRIGMSLDSTSIDMADYQEVDK